MRTRILIGALAAAVVVPGSAGQAASRCGSSLPAAPAGLPAPVVFRTECGTYRAAADGTVSRTHAVRSPWGALSRFRIGVRDRHVVVIEHGKVRWRSARAFTLSDSELDSAAFNSHGVAFSFGHGTLWVSRLNGHEHAVARREAALAWTRGGDLLTVQLRRGGLRLVVRDRSGLHPRVIARRPKSYFVDDATGTVLYVTASGHLVRSDGRTKQMLADLRSLGFGLRPMLQLLSRNMIGVASSKRLVLLRGDGSVYAAMEYPTAPAGLSRGWPTYAVGRDRVAVAAELLSRKGTVGEDVFVLKAGDRHGQQIAHEQAQWAGCGWVVNLVWHRGWLLYSDTVVDVLAIDTNGGSQVDLSKTARQLPGVQVDADSGEHVGLAFAVWG